MSILEKHYYHMDFQKLAMVIVEKGVVCVNKFGRPLVGKIQVVQDCTVPGRSQATILCRANSKKIAELRVVEKMHGKIQLTNSLRRLNCRGNFLSKHINPFTTPVKLLAGVLEGKYHSIQEEDARPALKTVAETQETRSDTR